MKNKKGEMELIVLVILIFLVIIALVVTYKVMEHDFQDLRDNYCISKGYNKSTDVSNSDERYIKSWDIECDNDRIFWEVRDTVECVEYNKFYDCIKEERKLHGGS